MPHSPYDALGNCAECANVHSEDSVPSITADIFECAAYVHGAASEDLKLYKGYPRYENRAKADMEMAQRVMDACNTRPNDWKRK